MKNEEFMINYLDKEKDVNIKNIISSTLKKIYIKRS